MEINTINPICNYIFVFAVTLVVFHLIFVWPKNLSKRRWKYVDYIWLIIGFLSIISLNAEIRHDRAEVAESQAVSRAATMHGLVLDLDTKEPNYFCRTFTRTYMSPIDFDEIQYEFQRACGWIRKFHKDFREATIPGYQVVDWTRFEPPKFSELSLRQSMDSIKQQMGYYEEAANELEAIRQAKTESIVESIFFFYWPYLFVVAVALRIAKTSGELMHER